MCGIAGIFLFDNHIAIDAGSSVVAMTNVLRHRGPDFQNTWRDEAQNIFLGHSRLSILDLSETGNQPMHSKSNRFHLVFNGEIYNHLELRNRLEIEGSDKLWDGTSDTETLLSGIEFWGIKKTLESAKGMFAFALWDSDYAELTLARDRFGEKPLYYELSEKFLSFGSELKVFEAQGTGKAELNFKAIYSMLSKSYVPDHASVYQGIEKVPPGTFVKISASNKKVEKNVYWSLQRVVEEQRTKTQNSRPISKKIMAEDLEERLFESVSSQMISDVPIGSFLSGGIDSTLITALMQKASKIPVRSFSIGFEEEEFNEAGHASEVANVLGTEHTSFIVTEKDALQVIPRIPEIYDEPFADSSQIPTYMLCARARQAVTVALTGDGADELFGGYNRYFLLPHYWKIISIFPNWLKVRFYILSSLLSFWGDEKSSLVQKVFKKIGLPLSLLSKIDRLGRIVSEGSSIDDAYDRLTRLIEKTLVCKLLDKDLNDLEERKLITPVDGLSDSEQMMYLDALTYLPGDILTKVDRASMSVSLETRAPYLDKDVVDFAWALKQRDKLDNKKGKLILRQILDHYVPAELIERPKQGFSVPLDRWMRGELRDWTQQVLDSCRDSNAARLNYELVNELWGAHLDYRGNYAHQLWNIVVLQSWLNNRVSNGDF